MGVYILYKKVSVGVFFKKGFNIWGIVPATTTKKIYRLSRLSFDKLKLPMTSGTKIIQIEISPNIETQFTIYKKTFNLYRSKPVSVLDDLGNSTIVSTGGC